jgi:hypothetical protein
VASSEGSIARSDWQLAWLLPCATVVHIVASVGSNIARSVQHVISPAQVPELAAPPSPVVPPLLPLLPSLPHADEQLCPSQSKTGPSQVEQLLVSHIASCEVHMVWTHVTHAAE